jgi:hypothetical protein
VVQIWEMRLLALSANGLARFSGTVRADADGMAASRTTWSLRMGKSLQSDDGMMVFVLDAVERNEE